MKPGYYVASMGKTLKLESRCFDPEEAFPGISPEDVRRTVMSSLHGWRDFIKSEKPKRDVFIIQVLPEQP